MTDIHNLLDDMAFQCVGLSDEESRGIDLLQCPFCGKTSSLKIVSTYEECDLEKDSDEAFAICCDASTDSNLGGCGASSGYELDIDTAKLKWNDRSNLPPANAYESVDIIELKRRVHSAIEHATDYETEISENAKQAHARVDLAFSLLANPSPICWKPLSDVQWMNIVNHDHAYENFDKDDAVHYAVKSTEEKCKENNTK